MEFGQNSINTVLSKSITLTNNGSFPFDFELIPLSELIEPNSHISRKTPRKKPYNKFNLALKPKMKRGNTGTITVGSFSISPSGGIVHPSTSCQIQVSFQSSNVGKFFSGVSLRISESQCSPPEIKFSTETFVPTIITSDYEKIFRHNHLCLRSDIIRKDMNVFLEDEQVFHFAPIVIQKQCVVEFYLINPLPISCSIDLSLKPKGKTNLSHFPFDISEKSLVIAGHSEVKVGLFFAPLVL